MELLKKHGLLVLIILIGVGWLVFANDGFNRGEEDRFNVVGQKLPALDGASTVKLPAGFPSWLILGSSADVVSGAKFASDPNLSVQYRVQFESPDTFPSLRDEYLTYFTKSGWTLEVQTNEFSLETVRGRESARVDLDVQGTDGLLVTVTYRISSLLNSTQNE